MKKILVSALALGGVLVGSVAQAGSSDDVSSRLAALEKENAAIRAENAALRQNKTLHERNAALKSSAAASPVQANRSAKRADPFGAYAADLPMAYKSRPLDEKGQLRLWGEGGAIWSGGDPVSSPYTLTDFTTLGTINRAFDLKPDVGWEAAGGFDYHFAGSPWHINGQFRYGEGRASGADSNSGSISAEVLGGGGNNNNGIQSIFGGSSITARNTETHWLADLGVGYDALGKGSDVMQVKFGARLAEYKSVLNNSNLTNFGYTFGAPINVGGGVFASVLTGTSLTAFDQRATFLGAGPRVGIEGSVPFAGVWSFDYQGDAAVLFGTQRLTQTTAASIVSVSAPLILNALGQGTFSTASAERFATVFNADLQVGLSYWITQNLKLSASYRIDAYFNLLNQTTGTSTNQTLDRYTHGPRLGVSATF